MKFRIEKSRVQNNGILWKGYVIEEDVHEGKRPFTADTKEELLETLRRYTMTCFKVERGTEINAT